MLRNIYTWFCGALMLAASLTPVAILFMEGALV